MNFKDEFGMTQLRENPVFPHTTSDNGPLYTVVRDEFEETAISNFEEQKIFYKKLFKIHDQGNGLYSQKPMAWDAIDPGSRDNIMPKMAKAYQLGLYDEVNSVRIWPRFVYTALGMDMPFLAYLQNKKAGEWFLWLHSLSCFSSCFRVYKTRPDIIDWVREGFPKREKISAPSGAHLVWARLHPLIGTDKEMKKTWAICTWIVEKRFGGWDVVFDRFYELDNHPNKILALKKYSDKK